MKANILFFAAFSFLSISPVICKAEITESFNEKITDILSPERLPLQSTLLIIGASFLAGVLVSFTPCVYPMIPVTVSLIKAKQEHAISRLAAYITGISCTYAFFGYLSAQGKILFGEWTQHPLSIFLIVAFFLYLGFSLLGFYSLYIPKIFSASSYQARGYSHLLSSLAGGMIVGTMASPCLTPALSLILGIISQLERPLLGAVSLFFFGLGMCLFLFIIGLSTSYLHLLPAAGRWMEVMNVYLASLLFITASYFLRPLIGEKYMFFLCMGLSFLTFAYCLVRLTSLFLKREKSASLYVVFFMGSVLFLGAFLYFFHMKI